MIEPELLKYLVCPETKQPLTLAAASLVERVNAQISAAKLSNRAGSPVSDRVDALLVRADGMYAYPVRGEIPVMLIDESLRVDSHG